MEVEQAALQLPAQARAALVQKLLLSLETPRNQATGIPDWVGIGASDEPLSVRDEDILKAGWNL